MDIRELLMANRREVATRIARAAAGLGIESASVYSEDDEPSLHKRKADYSVALKGRGVAG